MNKKPLVSVYITTRNRKKLLKRALASVFKQTYAPLEIIVVDDASTDGTDEMMLSLLQQFDNLRYIRLKNSSGANRARNEAIKHAKGLFVTGLDDDDFMYPMRIEKMYEAYNDKNAFVSSRYFVNDGKKRKYKLLTCKRKISLNDLLYSNVVGNQVFTTRKKLLQAGLFNEELPAAQDIDMWIRLLEKNGPATLLYTPLQEVFIHHAGRISTSKNKLKGYWQFYKIHKKKMTKNQRKFRLFEFRINKGKSLFKSMHLIPLHPKYAAVSLLMGLRSIWREKQDH